jgi:hypothetical protein
MFALDEAATDGSGGAGAAAGREDWAEYLTRGRAAKLRDIALSIRLRRTIEEAELALKLEAEYNADPSLIQDIDFASLVGRLTVDASTNNRIVEASGLVSEDEMAALRARQAAAIGALTAVQPKYPYSSEASAGAVRLETAVDIVSRRG